MRVNQLRILNDVIIQNVKSSLRLSAQEAPKYLNRVKEEVIYKKASEFNSWYTRMLGLDEVKRYQERVVTLQEKLLQAQDRRREIGQHLTEIRRKSNELQDQIHKVKRQDDLQRFLDLMKDETEVLKVERDTSNAFHECDREERELFSAFTNAVRDSHEKQRAQLEYTKYFGLILSLVGSFLTFFYSTLKKQDLKNFIEEHFMLAVGTSEPILKQVHENRLQLEKVINYINNESPKLEQLVQENQQALLETLNNPKFYLKYESKRVPIPLSSDVQYLYIDLNKIAWYSGIALVGFVVLRLFS